MMFDGVARREHLSRGQAKAAALVCTLALTRWLKDNVGEYPLLCVDDLESELDAPHAALVIQWLHETAVQSWLTGTRMPDASRVSETTRLFHVKHAECQSLSPIAEGADSAQV